MGRWRWDQESHLVQHEGEFYRLPRAALAPWWDRYHAWAYAPEDGPEPDMSDLLTPMEDEG
jgi:hypothetical protein